MQLHVIRVHRLLKTIVTAIGREGATADVYTAAIFKYLSVEVLELANIVSKVLKVKTPKHLQLAICDDEELKTLIKETNAGGGVIPNNRRSIINKSSMVSHIGLE